jgi:hypothetical protein
MSKNNGNLNSRIQYPNGGTESMLPGWPEEFDKEAYQSNWRCSELEYVDDTGPVLPYSSKDVMYVIDEEEAIDFIHTDGSPVKLGTAIGIDVDVENGVELQLFSDIMYR